MRAEIEIGSKSLLDHTRAEPELLQIDRELDVPYLRVPTMFNSEAWSRKLELPWIIARIGNPAELDVLDVGSGGSALPVLLARRGARVVSLDPKLLGIPNVKGLSRVKGGLPMLPFRDKSFDIVCCVSVLEHLRADMTDCFAELSRVARSKLLVTFDIATGPLSIGGLSRPELRAIGRMVGHRMMLPSDALRPTEAERPVCGLQLGVCLLSIESLGTDWPGMRLSWHERGLVSVDRLVRRSVSRLWGVINLIWQSMAGDR
jgi:SAM-dependent methyltransferase